MVHQRMCRWIFVVLFVVPLVSFSSVPVKSVVFFGDSLSDVGNTTHLLKSLRQEENPAFIVSPFKKFVINKMIDFANDYYVPQMVLDAGIEVVTNFFDNELAPYITNLIAKVKLVPVLPGKPYWKSRFSNGQVWSEYLTDMMAIQKSDQGAYSNRAFGGGWAATYDYQLTVWNLIRHPLDTIKTLIVGKLIPPSIGISVQAYLLEQRELNQESIFFMFAGSNDYVNALLFDDKRDPAIMSSYIDNVVEGIGAAVRKLADAGGKRFVIMGIPHIGDTPRFANSMDRDLLNETVNQHNTRLSVRVNELKQMYPDVDFMFIDIQEYLSRALNNPDRYGFNNIQDACIDVKFPMFGALAHSPFARNYVLQYAHVLQYEDKRLADGENNFNMCSNPDEYLFWDEIHPSTRAHNFIAYEVCLEMKQHGYEVKCKSPESAL